MPERGAYAKNKALRKQNPADWQESKKKYYQRLAENCMNFREPWTAEQEELIMDTTKSCRELGELLGRSAKSIEVRRAEIRRRERKEAMIPE